MNLWSSREIYNEKLLLAVAHRSTVSNSFSIIAKHLPPEYAVRFTQAIDKGRTLTEDLGTKLGGLFQSLLEAEDRYIKVNASVMIAEPPHVFITRAFPYHLISIDKQLECIRDYNSEVIGFRALLENEPIKVQLQTSLEEAVKSNSAYRDAKEVYAIMKESFEVIDIQILQTAIAIVDTVVKLTIWIQEKRESKEIAKLLETEIKKLKNAWTKEHEGGEKLFKSMNALQGDLALLLDKAGNADHMEMICLIKRLIETIISLNHNFYLGINYDRLQQARERFYMGKSTIFIEAKELRIQVQGKDLQSIKEVLSSQMHLPSDALFEIYDSVNSSWGLFSPDAMLPPNSYLRIFMGPVTNANFSKLSVDELINFMKTRVQLSPEEEELLRKQKIDGEAFMELGNDELHKMGLPMGVVVKLRKHIPKF